MDENTKKLIIGGAVVVFILIVLMLIMNNVKKSSTTMENKGIPPPLPPPHVNPQPTIPSQPVQNYLYSQTLGYLIISNGDAFSFTSNKENATPVMLSGADNTDRVILVNNLPIWLNSVSNSDYTIIIGNTSPNDRSGKIVLTSEGYLRQQDEIYYFWDNNGSIFWYNYPDDSQKVQVPVFQLVA